MGSLTSIQLLRGLAAWLVVYRHFVHYIPVRRFQDISWPGNLGVDIFFIISGFIMFYSLTNRMCTAREFFIKRVIRIVPAYWFYTFLMALLTLIYVSKFATVAANWNLMSLLGALFFIVTDPHISPYPLLIVGWTLIYEMFFYALITLCILIFGIYSLLACTIILIVLTFVFDNSWTYGFIYGKACLYPFIYGIALSYLYVRLKISRPSLSYVFGIALFILAIFLFTNDQLSVKLHQLSEGLRPLLAFLLVGSALCFESALSKIRGNHFNLLRYIGDISYSTYLLHLLVIGVLLQYIGNSGSVSEELFLMFMTFLIILILSHLSYKYIETGSRLKILKNMLIGR